MEFEYADEDLARLASDAAYTGSWSAEIVRKFRMLVTLIRNAKDERDFYALKSLRYEKLRGSRQHQRSMRLNKQWRLIIELHGDTPNRKVLIVAIEDYH